MSTQQLRKRILAAGLCLSGILLLLFNFNMFERYEPGVQYLLAALAALAGFGMFASYASARQNWWRLIPGWILLALAGIIFLSTFPTGDARWSAALLFAGLGAAFFHIFLLRRAEFWWALIPAGFMWVLGGVIALSMVVTRVETLGAFLFGGIGLVFFSVYLLGDRRQWWALMPGGILVFFGLFVLTWDQSADARPGALVQWWPLALIILGIVVGLRSRRQPSVDADKIHVHSAPLRSRSTQQRPRHEQPAYTVSTRKPAPASSSADKPLAAQSADKSEMGPTPGTSIEILPDVD